MTNSTGGQDHDLVKAILARDAIPSPHGWIQWKGTEVCIDLYCVCGNHEHYDGDFFYFYECSNCRRKYAVGMSVRLHELHPNESGSVPAESFKTGNTGD